MRNLFKTIGAIFLSFALYTGSVAETSPLADFSYQIKISPAESKSNYQLTPSEMLLGSFQGINPQIRLVGTLKVNSEKAARLCKVRFLQESIVAQNEYNQKIVLHLRGIIGGKTLGKTYATPEFNALNETNFEIEAYIDSNSYRQGLLPGNYTYPDDQLLTVEFFE